MKSNQNKQRSSSAAKKQIPKPNSATTQIKSSTSPALDQSQQMRAFLKKTLPEIEKRYGETLNALQIATKEVITLKTKMQSLESENKSLKKQVARMHETQVEHDETLESAENELNQLRHQNSGLYLHIQKLQETCDFVPPSTDRKGQSEVLQSLSQLQKQNDFLQRRLSMEQLKVSKLKAENTSKAPSSPKRAMSRELREQTVQILKRRTEVKTKNAIAEAIQEKLHNEQTKRNQEMLNWENNMVQYDETEVGLQSEAIRLLRKLAKLVHNQAQYISQDGCTAMLQKLVDTAQISRNCADAALYRCLAQTCLVAEYCCFGESLIQIFKETAQGTDVLSDFDDVETPLKEILKLIKRKPTPQMDRIEYFRTLDSYKKRNAVIVHESIVANTAAGAIESIKQFIIQSLIQDDFRVRKIVTNCYKRAASDAWVLQQLPFMFQVEMQHERKITNFSEMFAVTSIILLLNEWKFVLFKQIEGKFDEKQYAKYIEHRNDEQMVVWFPAFEGGGRIFKAIAAPM